MKTKKIILMLLVLSICLVLTFFGCTSKSQELEKTISDLEDEIEKKEETATISEEETPEASIPEKADLTNQCKIAFIQDGEIYVKNCDGSDFHQITFTKSTFKVGPEAICFSPDGQYIVFPSNHERNFGNDPSLYMVKIDGSELIRLTFGENHDRPAAWSPDGKLIAFHRNCALVTIAPDGTKEKVILKDSEICPGTLAWSPDSQKLAFSSWYDPLPDSDNFFIYTINKDGTNLKKLDKFNTGMTVTWSPDGKQIGVEGEGSFLINPDVLGEVVKVSSIPDSWHNWYWPQWDIK